MRKIMIQASKKHPIPGVQYSTIEISAFVEQEVKDEETTDNALVYMEEDLRKALAKSAAIVTDTSTIAVADAAKRLDIITKYLKDKGLLEDFKSYYANIKHAA